MYNYDNVTDDFGLAHFDHGLAYDHLHVIPMIKRVTLTNYLTVVSISIAGLPKPSHATPSGSSVRLGALQVSSEDRRFQSLLRKELEYCRHHYAVPLQLGIRPTTT
jgi:hypothetical protein